jgi:LysR family transcriptional regulator, transcriptional activator of the cysJI operon
MLLEARLRAFEAVASEQSFVGAAQRLHLSQPAVSKHIAALEREIGIALVIRRPSFQLTPAGQFLAGYVARAGALLDQAERGVRALVEADVGTLRLAASGTPGTYLVPRVVRRFVERRPYADVVFQLGTSAETLDAVEHHEVELGIIGGLGGRSDLDVEPILDDELVLVAAPALGRTRLRPHQLDDLLWVHREEGSATRVALEAALRAIGAAPRRRLALPSWEAIKLVVAEGNAVAAVSRMAIAVEQAAGTLIQLQVKGWRLGRPISVVRHADLPLSPLAVAFLTELQQHAIA